jgi:hypothetical protein
MKRSRGLNGPFVMWDENALCAFAFALLAAAVGFEPNSLDASTALFHQHQ